MITFFFFIISLTVSAGVERGVLPDGKKYYVFTGEDGLDSTSIDVDIMEMGPGDYRIKHRDEKATGYLDPVIIAAADAAAHDGPQQLPRPVQVGIMEDAFRNKYKGHPEAERIGNWLQGLDAWVDANMAHQQAASAEYAQQQAPQYQAREPMIIGIADEKISQEILEGRLPINVKEASEMKNGESKDGKGKDGKGKDGKGKDKDSDKDKNKNKNKSKAKNSASSIALATALGIIALASIIG